MVAPRTEGWAKPNNNNNNNSNNNNNNNRRLLAYNNLGVTKSHPGCHGYRAGMFCVWWAPSPKKELSITLFSLKHELRSITVDYYRLLKLLSMHIDQYGLL